MKCHDIIEGLKSFFGFKHMRFLTKIYFIIAIIPLGAFTHNWIHTAIQLSGLVMLFYVGQTNQYWKNE